MVLIKCNLKTSDGTIMNVDTNFDEPRYLRVQDVCHFIEQKYNIPISHQQIWGKGKWGGTIPGRQDTLLYEDSNHDYYGSLYDCECEDRNNNPYDSDGYGTDDDEFGGCRWDYPKYEFEPPDNCECDEYVPWYFQNDWSQINHLKSTGQPITLSFDFKRIAYSYIVTIYQYPSSKVIQLPHVGIGTSVKFVKKEIKQLTKIPLKNMILVFGNVNNKPLADHEIIPTDTNQIHLTFK